MWNVLALLLPLAGIRGTVRDIGTRAPVPASRSRYSDASRARSRTPWPIHARCRDGSPAALRRIGYATLEITPAIRSSRSCYAHRRALEGVTVTALRAEGARRRGADHAAHGHPGGDRAPVLRTGDAAPSTATPSVTAYSDGGAFSNYTYCGCAESIRRASTSPSTACRSTTGRPGCVLLQLSRLRQLRAVGADPAGRGHQLAGDGVVCRSVNFESVALGQGRTARRAPASRGAFNTTRGSAEWQSGLCLTSSPSTAGFGARHGRIPPPCRETRRPGGFCQRRLLRRADERKLTPLTGVSRTRSRISRRPSRICAPTPRQPPHAGGTRPFHPDRGQRFGHPTARRDSTVSATAYSRASRAGTTM